MLVEEVMPPSEVKMQSEGVCLRSFLRHTDEKSHSTVGGVSG